MRAPSAPRRSRRKGSSAGALRAKRPQMPAAQALAWRPITVGVSCASDSCAGSDTREGRTQFHRLLYSPLPPLPFRPIVRLALSLLSLQACFVSCAAIPGEGARVIQLRGVRLVDVGTGSVSDPLVVECRADRITAIGAADEVPPRPAAQTVEAGGQFLIPGLWDMHVHSHRDGRAERHYTMYVAHGVVGLREMGTHLGSTLDARDGADDERVAPRV